MSTFRKLVKVLVLVFIANALYQFVPPYYRYQRFKDGVREIALFSQRMSDVEVVDRVMALVDRLNVPVDRDSVAIAHPHPRIVITVPYTETMTFVPGRPYVWEITVTAEGIQGKEPQLP